MFTGLALVGVLYGVVALSLSYILVFHRTWYENTLLEPTLLTAVRWAFLAWLVFWFFSMYWALRGAWWPVPLLGGLARRKWVMRTALAGYGVFMVVVLVVSAAVIHASSLTERAWKPAPVYMLFDDMGIVPHWVFDLGFYPITLTATQKWGSGSVVVTPLTKESLAKSFREGRFVFVLSHGTAEGLYTREFKVRPRNAAPDGTGAHLKFVYITGCDSGALGDEWQRVLAPAEVVTFDRLSAWIEHIYWLLFKGAEKVRSLE